MPVSERERSVADFQAPRPDAPGWWGAAGRRPLLTIKDILWFWYLYPFRFVCARLSPIACYRLGCAIEPFCQALLRKQKKTVTERLATALGPKRSRTDLSGVGRRFVSNALWRALDDLMLHQSVNCEGVTCAEIHGLEHLKKALAAGKGALVVSGHFYANRLAKRYLAAAGYSLMSVRHQKPPDRGMGRVGAWLMQRQYIDLLHGVIRDEVFLQDPELSLKIFRRLRSGGLVNVHIDAPFSTSCLRLPFLGERRLFATGIFEIVRLAGCPVLPILCLGDSRGLRIAFEEPLALEPAGSRSEFAARHLPVLASLLEKQILEHPGEWEGWLHL